MRLRQWLPLLISLMALLAAASALGISRESRQLAASEITVEEADALLTPTRLEGSQQLQFLAIFEVNILNENGPSVTLQKIAADPGAGFLVALKGHQVLAKDIACTAFPVNATVSEVQQNPSILKQSLANDLEQSKLALTIEPGKSKTVRFGVLMEVFDRLNQPIADMVLISAAFKFDNGRQKIFRKAIPLQP
jgi:hypothetical protein